MPNRSKASCFLMTMFLVVATLVEAQDTKFVPGGPWEQLMIAPPDCLSPSDEWKPTDNERSCVDHEEWLNDITHWRAERRIRIGYDGSRYQIPSLQWTQSAFIQPQMMVEDRYFYDPIAGKYTVDRYLDDLLSRFGGIDAVLIWPTYPNMGVDDREADDRGFSSPWSSRPFSHDDVGSGYP